MKRIIAVAVLALVASSASATNSSNPKEKSAKAVGIYGCDICSGSIVKTDARARGRGSRRGAQK